MPSRDQERLSVHLPEPAEPESKLPVLRVPSRELRVDFATLKSRPPPLKRLRAEKADAIVPTEESVAAETEAARVLDAR